MKMKQVGFILLAAVCIVSCTTPPYVGQNRSRTAMFGDNIFRYGTIAGAGAGGYFVGDSMGGGDPMWGGIGAAAGAGLTYAIHKVYDKKQMDAYQRGVSVGIEQGREELLNEMWKREAVYGMPPEGSETSGAPSMVRNVYVPSRTVNNVRYNSGYQQVMLR